MADKTSRRYLFVAIDWATPSVFIRVFKSNARRCLRDVEQAGSGRSWPITGRDFTDGLFGLRKRAASGKHVFDQFSADLGIEHC